MIEITIENHEKPPSDKRNAKDQSFSANFSKVLSFLSKELK